MNMKEFFGDVRKHLMSGVSFMLPVIIVYAFFLVLGQIPGELGVLCFKISLIAQSLIAMVLAAYIAFSIVGKLGLAPTLIVAYFATASGVEVIGQDIVVETLGMGFIGGIIVGLLMGYIIKGLVVLAGKFKQGQANDIVTSFIVVPVISVLAGGALVYFVIASPVNTAMAWLYAQLEGMSTGSAVLIALILGAMIAFDMGGPVNKVAYTFAIAASDAGLYHVVAPVLVAITVPVLSVGLATIIFKGKYTDDERVTGKSALFMSIFGLTEGAIPFAVVNPFRVIPALIVGSMAGAASAALFSVTNTSVIPSLVGIIFGGGSIVNILLYLLAHAIGTAVCVTLLIVLKQKEEEAEDEDEVVAESPAEDKSKEKADEKPAA